MWGGERLFFLSVVAKLTRPENLIDNEDLAKTAVLLRVKLKYFSREKGREEILSNSRRGCGGGKSDFLLCIFIASPARFAPPLNIPAAKDFRRERVSDPPVAGCADCFHEDFHREPPSFSVCGALKSFWRLCRMKNQLTRCRSLLTRGAAVPG